MKELVKTDNVKKMIQEIKILQHKLDSAIEYNMLNRDELLKLSQELDKLIVNYYDLKYSD